MQHEKTGGRAGDFDAKNAAENPHSLNHRNGHQLLAALGPDRMQIVKKCLAKFSVDLATREQYYYSQILVWLSDGITGQKVEPADVEAAARDLERKKKDGSNALTALKFFVRTAAMRRASGGSSLGAVLARTPQPAAPVPGVLAIVMRAQPWPPGVIELGRIAQRLADELAALGRSRYELPEDPADWPATYLPHLGPWPCATPTGDGHAKEKDERM